MTPMREARRRLGITQAELAEKVGSSQAHISNVESGKDECSVNLARKLAKILGISASQIVFPEEH